MRVILSILLLLLLLPIPSLVSAEDVVEFVSGAKVTGTVKEIRKDKKRI